MTYRSPITSVEIISLPFHVIGFIYFGDAKILFDIPVGKSFDLDEVILVLGFKLIAGAIASCAFIGVAIGVGLT